MNEYEKYDKYEPVKIPPRSENKIAEKPLQIKNNPVNIDFSSDGIFAEVVINGAENDIRYAPQKIFPAADEKHKTFVKMKQIARENQSLFVDHAKIFYLQALYLEDFEDDFKEQAPFFEHYPYYRIMDYMQFRTYFTWRTNVRKGNVTDISASYAYVYIYELLNNIGVKDPAGGMEKLLDFRKAFGVYNKSTEKYIFKWLEDYHVYYGLTEPFKDFVQRNGIETHYPYLSEKNGEKSESDKNKLYFTSSKYDVKSSVFYNENTRMLVKNCFYFVINRLRRLFEAAGMSFDKLVFQSGNNEFAWTPFSDALFYPRHVQPDRETAISDKITYICRQNKWSCRSEKITESGKRFIGYIMKKTEAALRKAEGFKHKLSVNPNMLDDNIAVKILEAGIQLDKAVEDGVSEFYRELNRKVIAVNPDILDKVRREASDIQDKLIVEVQEPIPEIVYEAAAEISDIDNNDFDEEQACDEWTSFRQSLTKLEIDALKVILQENGFTGFCAANNVMPEVLIDGINQKACDTISDNITDGGDFPEIYEEYRKKIIEMVNI